MKISPFSRKRKGFTLIELLIVIAILGVLGGIAYPIYMSMSKEAERSAARKVCTDIQGGVTTFSQDHNGMLPYDPALLEEDDREQIRFTTEAGKDGRFIAILTKRESEDDDKINTEGNIYLRSDENQDEKMANGLYVTSEGVSLFDPWGKPYYIVLCPSDAGCIDPFTDKQLRQKCLAYSTGPDGEGAAPDATSSASPKAGKKGKKDKKDKKDKKKKKSAPKPAVDDEEFAEAIEDNVYSWKEVD